MTLTLVLIALLGAGEVSLTVAPGVSCVEPSRLVSRLEAAGLRVTARPSGRLAVSVRREQDHVLVRATWQGAPFERSLPAQPEDCEAIERVLAALIASWSQQLPTVVEPKPPPLQVKVPKVTAPVPVPSEPEPEAEPVRIVEAPPQPEPSAVPRQPFRVPAVEVAAPLVSPPASSTLPFTLDAAALGGGGLGPTAAVAGLGQLQVGFLVGRLGALLEGGLESSRSGSTASGARVESNTQWLSLSARLGFRPAQRLRLDLALGFRLWRITAQGLNTFDAQSLELLGLGGVLSGGASFQLIGPLALHLRAFASLRATRPRFLINGFGPVLTLDPFEAGLLLGLELRSGG